MMETVLTPERLAAAQEAARQQLLKKARKAVAGDKPAAAPPPRPPTLKERMKGGGIVPLDELLAHKDELVAAAEQEREQLAARSQRERDAYTASQTAFEQQRQAFGELCTFQGQLAAALGRRDSKAGEMQQLLGEQIKMRCKVIAQAINESWRAVDEASQIVAAAQAGKHFGDLSYLLEAAVRYGFWERLAEEQYRKMSDRNKRRAIFSRGTRYFPVERPSVLQNLVNDEVRNLFRRAIDTAEAERPAQLGILESGLFPTAYELYDLVDASKALLADRQFGCVLVQLRVPKGEKSVLVSGIAQLAFVNVEGAGKCIAVQAVNGSASRVLQPGTLPLANLAGSPAFAAVVRHLSDIAAEALLTDEQASQLNDARRAKTEKGRREPTFIPTTEVERQFRFLELAGELWRDRNSKWIEKEHRVRQATAAQQQPATATAGSESATSPPAEAASSEAASGGETAGKPPKRPRGKGRKAGKKAAEAEGGNGATGPAVPADASPAPTSETPAS